MPLTIRIRHSLSIHIAWGFIVVFIYVIVERFIVNVKYDSIFESLRNFFVRYNQLPDCYQILLRFFAFLTMFCLHVVE